MYILGLYSVGPIFGRIFWLIYRGPILGGGLNSGFSASPIPANDNNLKKSLSPVYTTKQVTQGEPGLRLDGANPHGIVVV